jgi:histidyl-tRNA synthetase
MEDLNLFPPIQSATEIVVTVFAPDLLPKAQETTMKLRSAGIPTDIYPDPTVKLEKQIKYAFNKGVPYIIVQGPDEQAKNVVQLKNLSTKEQTELTVEQVIDKLTKAS